MTLTKATILATVTHTLGGSPDARSTEDIANMAGRELLSMRSWQWATDVAGTAALVASQDYATLPSDFLGLLTDPRLTGSPYSTLRMVGIQTIEEYRSTGSEATGTPTHGSLTRVSVSGSALVHRLQLWPTPNTSDADGLTFFYRKGWPGLPADDDDVLSIPDFMENLYTVLVVVFARAWEDDIVNPVLLSNMVAALKADRGGVYWNAVETDNAAQSSYGTVRGGVGARTRLGGVWMTGSGDPV